MREIFALVLCDEARVVENVLGVLDDTGGKQDNKLKRRTLGRN